MNRIILCAVTSLILTFGTGAAHAESDGCKVDPNDVKAITKLLKKQPKLGKGVEVFCPDKVENYARVGYDTGSAGGSAYLVKTEGKWKVLTFGPVVDDDNLSKHGVPKSVIDKFNK